MRCEICDSGNLTCDGRSDGTGAVALRGVGGGRQKNGEKDLSQATNSVVGPILQFAGSRRFR